MRNPTFTNIFYYMKHFFFKSAFGRLILVFMFVAIFNMYLFSQFYWPKIREWVHNSTSTSVETSTDYPIEEEF